MNKETAVMALTKATEGLTSEEFNTVCMYLALLNNPETRITAMEFGDRIISGENVTFHDLKDFCSGMQAQQLIPE